MTPSSSAAPVSDPPPPFASRVRWQVCGLLFFATTINYMDRQILGLLAPNLQKEIGWNEVQYARLVIAFQAAYAFSYAGFGRLIDRIGARNGYSLAIVFWSLAAMGHALARSVFGFGLARFALGLGEGGNFPAAVKAVTEWFPRRERALATGLFNAGANVGAVLAPLTVPGLTEAYGWRAAFVVLGAVGFVWVVFWWWLYESPRNSRRVSAAERALILSDPPPPAGPRLAWGRLLGYRQTWAYIVGTALSAPIWWFYLYWLPKFLGGRFGLDLQKLGPPLVLIYSLTSLGSVGGGWFSGYLLRRGWSVNAARKTALLVCALAVMPVMLVTAQPNLWVAAGLVGLAAAAHQGWAANLYTLVSDLFPKEAVASVVGIGGTCGSLMAMVFSESAGTILQRTGSYWSLFLISGSAYIVALGIIQWLVPSMDPVGLTSVPADE